MTGENLRVQVATHAIAREELVLIRKAGMFGAYVGLGIDRNAPDASCGTGPDQSDGNLTTVCDEDLFQRIELQSHFVEPCQIIPVQEEVRSTSILIEMSTFRLKKLNKTLPQN
jgi:hypothetical protein